MLDEYVQTRMSLGRIDGKDPYFRTRSHSKARLEHCAADQHLRMLNFVMYLKQRFDLVTYQQTKGCK